MSRIADCFNHAHNKCAFIPYIMAGDPDIETSLGIMHALADNGAAMIEIGFPFSDPTADGAIIQQAGQRSLLNGTTLTDALLLCKQFREMNNTTPLILMGYANPVLQLGYATFADMLSRYGVDGTIIVDIPLEEEKEYAHYVTPHHIDIIRLIAPTASEQRIQTLANNATGFLYTVNIKGITGTHSSSYGDIEQRIAHIKKHTDLPIVAGFGIKDAHQAKALSSVADGVVVGSALVSHMHEVSSRGDNIIEAAAAFTQSMVAALQS